VAVGNHNRAQRARTQAIYRLQRKLLVRSCLPSFDAKLPFQLFHNPWRAPDVASCPKARTDKMLAPWFQAEGAIERGDAIYVDKR